MKKKRQKYYISRRDFLKLGAVATTAVISKDAWACPGKKIKHFPARAEPEKWVYSTCGYCAVGCGMLLGVRAGKVVTVKGDPQHSTNRGRLCQKGIWEHLALHHPQRLTRPLLRKVNGKFSKKGKLAAVSWQEALEAMRQKFSSFSPQRMGVLSTGQLATEEMYALCKLVRVALRTPHFDGNTTLCMASTVVGYAKSFGSDGPPGCYDDFNKTDLVLALGSNMSECHPLIFYRMDQGKKENKFFLIAVDPRRTQLARHADMHLAIRPGTDNILLYGIAHILIRNGWIDTDFIKNYTNGFAELKASLARFTPEKVARITGIKAAIIQKVASRFHQSYNVVSCWAPALNQSIHGVANVTAVNNLHLLTAKIGRPGTAPFSFTGQCNAMGGRELDGKGKTLPGYRLLTNPAQRKEIAKFWQIDEKILPQKPGYSHTEIINASGAGEIDGLWVIATNPVISLPDANHTIQALKKVKFLVVQDIFPTATTRLADLVLPAGMWSEKTGVMTNSERRVNLAVKAQEPPGQAKSDFDIFLLIAEKFGYRNLFSGWKGPEDAFKEMKRATTARPCDYSGITYERIKLFRGMQWPVRNESSFGTPRLYRDFKFNTENGRANLVPVMDIPAIPEPVDEEYSFVLNTGRLLEHWHTSTKTGRIIPLQQALPHAFMEIHPEDAKKIGVKQGEKVKIKSRRGEIVIPTRITSIISPGTLFIPFFDPDILANNLTINRIDALSKQPNYKQCAVQVFKI